MNRTQGALIALAALAVSVFVLAPPGQASFPRSGNTIFFTGRDPATGGDPHLYSVRSDGAALTSLSAGPAADLSVRAAPGGRLAVTRDTHAQCGHVYWAQGYDLFTMNRDGGGLTRLTDNCPISDEQPAWSPSGRHLVFSRSGELWSMRSDGTDLAKLTCNVPSGQDPGAYQPDWSPDGRQIAFDLYGDIDVMTPAGADIHKVATGSGPSFSPDGSQLAYAGPPFGSSQGIHILTLASGADARLTSGYDGAPAWSPDGTTIVFAHADDPARNWVLQTIGADGRGLRTIVDTVNPTSVDWAADTSDTASEPDVTAADTSCAETASAAAPAAPPAPVVEQSPPTVIAPVPMTVPASSVERPNRLRLADVVFRPRVLRSRRAFVLTVVVHDLAGRSVRGAVVRAKALRGDAEATSLAVTSSDGTVMLRVVPNRRLVLAAGRRLVLTVQARRPQDGWASSRSAVRLVSVRTKTA